MIVILAQNNMTHCYHYYYYCKTSFWHAL